MIKAKLRTQVKLGDVVEFLDHRRRPITAKDRIPGEIPYYGANGQQDSVSGFIFDEPLVLLAEDGGYFDNPSRGIAYMIEGRSWVNNHAHVLRPRTGTDIAFLARVLENYDVRPFLTGTTRAKLTKAAASRIPIGLPPLDEQRRIAALLDKADELRTKRRQAVAHLDTLTQSVFHSMFDRSSPFKSEMLEDVTTAIVDCPHSTPTWTKEGVTCLRTSNLGFGEWNWSDHRFVSEHEHHQRSKRMYLEPGDIVLSREGTVGVLAIVPEGMKASMGQRLVQVRTSSRINNRYLLHLLLRELSPAVISHRMVGATSRHINVKDLRKLSIPIPPLELQEAFAQRVAAVERLKEVHRKHLAELDALFASLQHRAFKGEL